MQGIPRLIHDVRPARLLTAGLCILALGAGVMLWSPELFFQGYLAAFSFWMAFPLAGVGLLAMHALAGGRWGEAVRTEMETAAGTAPLLAVFFVPIALGLPYLYPWAAAGTAFDHLPPQQQSYLAMPFVLARSAAYLICWGLIGLVVYRSANSSAGRSSGAMRGGPAAAVLIFYVLSVSFASIDWVASIQAHWYSSIFGLYIVVGQALSVMALMILVEASRQLGAVQAGEARSQVLHDQGNLFLALVALHAYIGFSQFFIIWNGNLPHETSWYAVRMNGFWGGWSILIMIVHFALPLALLLSRDLKRRPDTMLLLAVVVLAARFADVVWTVLPGFDRSIGAGLILAALLTAGLGAVWWAAYRWCRSWMNLGTQPAKGPEKAA